MTLHLVPIKTIDVLLPFSLNRSSIIKGLNKIFMLPALVALFFFFAGCGQKTPSADDVKLIIGQMIQEDSKGRIKMVDFNITERLSREHTYIVEFEGQLEFTEDTRWLRGRSGFKTMPHSNTFTGWNHFFVISQNPGTDHKSGEQIEFRGHLTFEQTESGWRVAQVNIQ